jgi:hypothetical protein
MRYWLLAILLSGAVPQRVSIRVSPLVLMAGGALRVTCVVPRDARNRQLSVALSDYTSSSRQLDGDQARITHEFIFSHVPCVVEDAACQVVGTDGSLIAKQHIEVVGCEK